MATDPPPFLTFRTPGETKPPRDTERVPVYQLALDLASQLYTIVELSETVERFYLRDTLDRTSTIIPILVSQALASMDMPQRRVLYGRARHAATECAAILDVLRERGTVEDQPLSAARATTTALLARLEALSDRWRETAYPSPR